jgi:hypothetical protein
MVASKRNIFLMPRIILTARMEFCFRRAPNPCFI